MNQSAIALLACSLMLWHGCLGASEISLRSVRDTCEREIPEDKAALVHARRKGTEVDLDVVAQFTCESFPGTPNIEEWRTAATVSVQSQSKSEDAELCLCTRKISFVISKLGEGVRTIYYAQDGVVLGHADAP